MDELERLERGLGQLLKRMGALTMDPAKGAGQVMALGAEVSKVGSLGS
jgi:hypothetical protein